MHPEQIKAEIRMAGTTPAVIAVELGVSRTTVSQIIHGTGRSARIECRISEIIKKPAAEIWPNRPKPLPKATDVTALSSYARKPCAKIAAATETTGSASAIQAAKTVRASEATA